MKSQLSSREIEIRLFPLHPGQKEIIDNAGRFNVVDCGRRWGKTKLCEELIASPDDETNGALHGFPVAYFAPTYRMLMEVWREMQDIYYELIRNKSETEKRLDFHGGGSIDFWSLEDPNSIRGRKYKRTVLDEAAIARNLREAWLKVIRPTLTDLKGDSWFLSTPKGKNNYFYELFTNDKKYADWKSWQRPTVDNPHISEAEVEEARLQLDPLTFAQEYLASFVTENLDSWAYCFEHKKHIGKTTLERGYETYLSFDFNKNPITCGVFQHHKGIRCIEQIKLQNSNIYDLCDYINANYPNCMFIVTGDATGKASNALVQDNINYYTVIKTKLNLAQGQIKVPPINPTMKENRVIVNSILHNQDVLIDPDKCKGLIFDLEHARVLPNGDLEKTDRNDPMQQLDSLDCMRYYLNTFHKHLLTA